MELNTKARYAVMAMADLAKFGAVAAVPLSAIAQRQNLSLAYLEQIFLRLRPGKGERPHATHAVLMRRAAQRGRRRSASRRAR